MAWNITERFPSWGETGEFPAAGFFYEGGDQVNEKHLDALWNGINGLEEDVQAALSDIDSNADGKVDNAEAVDGNSFSDIQTWVNNNADVSNADYADNAGDAETVDGEHADAFADTNHGNEEHSTTFTTLTEVNNNADVPNADYADNAGDANTVDGEHASNFAAKAITITDEATDFDGSDGENVTKNQTVAENGYIGLANESTATRSPTDQFDQFDVDYAYGFVIVPYHNTDQITVEISSVTSGVTRVKVQDTNENMIQSVTGGPWSDGDTITVSNLGLSADTEYLVGVDNQGSNYTIDGPSSANYPFESPLGRLESGYAWDNGDRVDQAFGLLSVSFEVNATSGNAVISWPSPTDIYSWDIATFQQTPDGGNVTVDVEDANGNTIASDIGRNYDISSVAGSTNIQIRANFSRSSTSENPTLDYTGRQYRR